MSDPEIPEVQPNVLSILAHVIGFTDAGKDLPPTPAPDPREADVLLMHWLVSNTTEQDITWHFETQQLFKLTLERLCGGATEVLWELKFEGKVTPFEVVVPKRVGDKAGIYSIPPEDPEENVAPPTIPLAEIVKELSVPIEDELVVRFRLLAAEFPQESVIPLWRSQCD